MPSVLHPPLINTSHFMLKDKSGEPFVTAFTAVNGRTSPPSPPMLNGVNGMTRDTPIHDTIHVRQPFARHSPEQPVDQKVPISRRDERTPATAPRHSEHPSQNGYHSSPSPPSLSPGEGSPASPGKRKRSSSAEDERSRHSPEGSVGDSRARLDSYPSVSPEHSHSPNSASQVQHLSSMEHHLQQRTLPPLDRGDSGRDWPRESQEVLNNGYSDSQHRDPRSMDPSQNNMMANSNAQSQGGSMGDPHSMERTSTTEITRAGVHVDPKKRKRQFANRTKTGCGTCRRRKKKCDEAKPECNNCSRGGFICEGYANKVPWPKNGTAKPHPPLQAKDRFPVESAQLYHSHGASREGYPDPAPATNGSDRERPIVVEEHNRQPPRSSWGSNGWSDPARASYPSEHPPPTEYPQPPPNSTHGRPPSNDHHVAHPSQGPVPSRPHNPRIYHHTPQTMSQVVNTSPAVTAEAALHHQAQQGGHQPPMAPTTGPPAPPPTHYAQPPPRPQKSEKEKMLSGEPFMPYHSQLVDERERCRAAVYRFNNTSNGALEIAPGERERHFKAILAARWVQHFRGVEPQVTGHLGGGVHIDTPFNCSYGYNISIGDNVDIGANSNFCDSGRIAIGRNTTIGVGVTIETQKVPSDSKLLKGSGRSAIAADVYIGENVYIGPGCTILAGVRIGNGAIVHPGSVVVRDVPRDCTARGNPAEVRMVNWED